MRNIGAAGIDAYNRETGQFYTMRQVAESDFIWGTYTDSGLSSDHDLG